MMYSNRLTWIDYVVFLSFLLISVAIGVYHACTGGKQKSAQEFISGNKKLAMIPTMISLVLSYVSAIIILGTTAEIYTYGTMNWIWIAPAFFISSVLAERVYVPWIYNMRITSIFQFLSIRYRSHAVHIVGVILGLTSFVFYTGTAFYAPALALEAVSGLSVPTTLSIMAVVCTFYTALGGMKAVVYTDCFQGIVLLAGCLAIMIKAFMLVGGAGPAFSVANEEGRIILTDFSVDPRERHTVWGFLFGITWTSSIMFGLAQPTVQRYTALPTLSKARQVTLLAAFPFVLVNVLVGLIGIAIYAYYSSIECDPIQTGVLFSPNQLVPYFVVTVFKSTPGVAGLFIAALFGGAMSSISSSLSACAAVAWKDIVQVYRPHTTDKQGAIINKLLVIMFALIMVGLAFLASAVPNMPLLQTTLAFVNVSSGPVTGLILMGGLFKVANWKGGLAGCIVGIAAASWVGFGTILTDPPTRRLPSPSNQHCVIITAHNYTDDVTMTSLEPVSVTSYIEEASYTHHDDVDPTGVIELSPEVSGINHLYTLSYVWYALFGTIITVAVGMLVSWCTDTVEMRKHLTPEMFIRWEDIRGPVCGAEPALDINEKESKSQ